MWTHNILFFLALSLRFGFSAIMPSTEMPHSLHRRARLDITCSPEQRDLLAINLVNVARWAFWANKVAAGQSIDVVDTFRVNIFREFFGDYDYATRVAVRRRFWWLLEEADRSPGGRFWERDQFNPSGRVTIFCDDFRIFCEGENAEKETIVWGHQNAILIVCLFSLAFLLLTNNSSFAVSAVLAAAESTPFAR